MFVEKTNKEPLKPIIKSLGYKLKSKSSSKDEKFCQNEKVFYRNHFKNDVKWLQAVYLKQISQYTALIKLKGIVRMVHLNQLRKSNLHDKFPIDEPILAKCPSPSTSTSVCLENTKEKKVRFQPVKRNHTTLKKRSRSLSDSPDIPRRSKRIKSYISRGRIPSYKY